MKSNFIMNQIDNQDQKNSYAPHRSYINRNLTRFPSFNELSPYMSLSFANNPISSLETLPTLPSLKVLNLSGTDIESFYGVSVQPSLEKLYIKNTPISYFHDVRIMCIAAFGPSIKFINNESLTTYEIKMGNCFFNTLNSYLRRGWIISGFYPVKLVNLQTHERRIVDVKLPVINLRTYACVSDYQNKYSMNQYFPDLLNTISSNTESYSIKTPFKTKRKCALNSTYVEPIPSYLPKGIEKISQMTPEELRKAVKKCLCIKEKKQEEKKDSSKDNKKKRSVVRLRKRKQDKRFFDTPETLYLREQDAANTENIGDNIIDGALKLSNYEKDIEEIPLIDETINNNNDNSKQAQGNMQKYFDQLNALGSLEKPSEFIYKNIPTSSTSSTSSTYSISASSSSSDIISDAALDKQLKEIAIESSDLLSISDSNFDSSFSNFLSGVEDLMSPKRNKKGKQKRQNNRRKITSEPQVSESSEAIEFSINEQSFI